MAYIFELAVECGPGEEDAKAVGRFFDGYPIKIQGSQGELLSSCRIVCWQDKENNWWCSVFPSGVSEGLSDNTIKSKEEILEVTSNLYDRLKSAPCFRYAVAGFEVTPFDTYSQLLRDKGANHEPFDGLVLNRTLWEEIGRPSGYEPFTGDTYWFPIKD